MKSVIAAAVLFVLLLSLALYGSALIIAETDTLLMITISIPEDVQGMHAAEKETRQAAEQLAERWGTVFPYLAYVTGYTALNRTDDAILELCGAVRASSFADAVTARGKLLDALYRMRELERLSFSSVF